MTMKALACRNCDVIKINQERIWQQYLILILNYGKYTSVPVFQKKNIFVTHIPAWWIFVCCFSLKINFEMNQRRFLETPVIKLESEYKTQPLKTTKCLTKQFTLETIGCVYVYRPTRWNFKNKTFYCVFVEMMNFLPISKDWFYFC